jgi:hypothetical protein
VEVGGLTSCEREERDLVGVFVSWGCARSKGFKRRLKVWRAGVGVDGVEPFVRSPAKKAPRAVVASSFFEA